MSNPEVEGWNRFLVVTKYKQFSQGGNSVTELFQKFEYRVLSENPCIVILGTGMELKQVAEYLGSFSFEYEISPLGRTEVVKGIGLP